MLEGPNVSNAALVVTMLGVAAGILLSIILYRRTTRNERFVEKCRREGCSTRAVEVKRIDFYDRSKREPRNLGSKYIRCEMTSASASGE